MPGKILPRSFYARPTVEVARALIGSWLVHGSRQGRILETEAYLPTGDEAAHSWRGRTPRTQVLFGPPGYAYVYFIYGMYDCLNIVAEPEGTPGCVLIRSVEGQGNGPGRLTRAMGITRAHYGVDLTQGDLVVRQGAPISNIQSTPRIGIRRNPEPLLRFIAMP